jgi:putative transposase
MSRYSIKVGETVAINGERFEIVNIVGRKTQARAVETGELRDWPTSELLSFYEKGQMRFTDLLSQSSRTEVATPKGEVGRTLQDFPEPVRKKALRKWKYLRAICPEGPIRMSRTALLSTLRTLAPEIEEKANAQPPSPRTFYRWHRTWVNTQMDVRALADRSDLRGRKPLMNYPQRLATIITEGIETFYLTNQRQTKQELQKWIHHETKLVNRTLPSDEALPLVNTRTVNKFLSQYDRYHILKARYGERYARQSVQTFGKGPHTDRPLQRIEIDHTPCDIQVIDERTKLVLGRPWITVAIDHFSRMIVGMHIGFRGPSADSVLRCLRNAIAPKTYVKERFPAVEGEWPCYGLMEEIWVDNGLEFHGKALEAAAQELGIHVHYCPARQPHYKGTVERFNRTLNHGVLHRLPGTTFSNYPKRLQYKSDEESILSLSELEEIIHHWVIDVYGCEFHRGIQSAPQQKWAEGVALSPPKLPPDLNALKVYLSQTERRHLSKNGIQANGLRYGSDALQEMRHRYGDIEVTVRIDPDDLETIYVLDEKRKIYVMAQCILPGYAEGLSTEQHKLISKKAKADYEMTPYAGRLLSAKAAIRERAAAILAQHRKTGEVPSKKPSKLNREAREILQKMPDFGTADPAVEAGEILSSDIFLDDDWIVDVPDFTVDNRPFQQSSLNI